VPAGRWALQSCDGMETLNDRIGCEERVHNVFSLPEET
jgi:hypothetical protein